MFKNVASAAQKVTKFMTMMVKFLSTFIGQIVFFLVIILFVGLLVYNIANVIVTDIAGIIDIDGPGMKEADSSSADYEVLRNLYNSGYNSVMPADELQDYSAFEYACLMDAAWYLKKTGAYSVSYVNQATFDLGNMGGWINELLSNPALAAQAQALRSYFASQGIDFDALSDSGKQRMVWATLAAQSDDTNKIMQDIISQSTRNTSDTSAGSNGRMDVASASGVGSEASGGTETGGGDEVSNEATSKEVFFRSVTSPLTGETSLVPYLIIHRTWNVWRFRFYDTNPQNRYDSAQSLEMAMSNPLYTFRYIDPLMANELLNGLNVAARFGICQVDGSGEPLDLYAEYPESMWYDEEPVGPVTYEIPFKVLIDRYLPKAVLLSAWYAAKDSSPADNQEEINDLLDEIVGGYTKACLKGESHDDGVATTHAESFMHFERGVAEQTVPTYNNWYAINPPEQLFIATDLDEVQSYKFPEKIVYKGIPYRWYEDEDGQLVQEWGDLVVITFSTKSQSNPEKIDPEILRAYSYETHSYDIEDVENEDKPKEDGEDIGFDIIDGKLVKTSDNAPIVDGYEVKSETDNLQETKLDTENDIISIHTKYADEAIDTGGASFVGLTDQIHPGTLVIKREQQADGSYDTTPPKNAAPSDLAGYNSHGQALKSPPPGESEILEDDGYTYMKMQLGPDGKPVELVCTDPEKLYEKLDEIFFGALAEEEQAWDARGWTLNLSLDKDSAHLDIGNRYAMFTVEERICTLGTDVEYKNMPMYFTKLADTWSSVKYFHTRFIMMGNIIDPNNYLYLVPKQRYNTGLSDIITVIENMQWRTELFAPLFGGGTARESDITLMMSEWEKVAKASTENSSAYTYMRDLYRLIHYTKGVKDKDGEILKEAYAGGKYVDEDSYTFLHVEEEITTFDETTSEIAFWLDRFLATLGMDKITEQENREMRNSLPLKTWQIVDYGLYPEVGGKVYLFWPLGGTIGKTVIASSLGADNGYNMLMEYGSWEDGVHNGNDWNGRAHAHKVYQSIYNQEYDPEEPLSGDVIPTITSSYSGGTVTLQGDAAPVKSLKGRFKLAEGPVTIDLEGTKYTYSSALGASYAYHLYRNTLIMKSAVKARQYLKEQLEEEIMWTPVVAVAPGYVQNVSASAAGGFEVTVKHTDNEITYSCHMKRYPVVQEGQYVGNGTVLGYEGTTGNSGGYHVHFSLKDGEKGNDYVFPFFSPFFFEEKTVGEDGNALGLDSEYWSIERTSYPVGLQVPSGAEESDEWQGFDEAGAAGTNSILEKENGGSTIIIKNYVPSNSLVSTWRMLYNDTDHIPSGYEELNYPVPIEPYESIGGAGSSAVTLKANPEYFGLNSSLDQSAEIDEILRQGAEETENAAEVQEKTGSFSSSSTTDGDA